MKILIVGANGLLGRNLVEKLSESYNVYAVLRNKSNIKFKVNSNIEIIQLDLNNFDIRILPSNIDAIYYLAQSNKFRNFPEFAEDIININVYAPFKIINWALKNNVKKFIYASSGGIYASSKSPLKENFEIYISENIGFYLSSKLSAEIILKNYSKFFETFAIIRPFFVYGKGQNQSMLIPRLIYNIKNNKKIIINKNGGIKLNPIYVEDATEAIANILNLSGNYIFNIAGNEIVSLKELSYIIGSILNKKPIFEITEKEQNDLVADITLMKKLLINPKISLHEGLKKVIEN